MRKKQQKTASPRNPLAKSLRSPHLRQQVLPKRPEETDPDWDELLDEIWNTIEDT